MEEAIAVLRVTDATQSFEWYRRLGYEKEWTYSFEPGMPVAASLARQGAARLMLSEHAGDAKPEGLVYLYLDDIEAVAREFEVGIIEQPWGREIHLVDPDGNRLRVGDADLSS
jgi:catechol 2,3-dioxygenase-like lactoylglutathione lyase family enzyme